MAINNSIRPAILLALTGALLSPMAHANPVPVTFQASGTFQDGSTLSGTILIDTVAGSVISGDLAISGHVADFTTFELQRTWPPTSPFLYEASFGNGQPTGNYLTFLFPPVSLVGYAGGILCGAHDLCLDSANNQYFSNFGTLIGGLIDASTIVELDHGSLVETPEPSKAAICLMALALVALGIRRALARNAAR